MNNLKAYELIRKEDLSDIHSTGYLLRHTKSGARVMLISNDDENKVFHIAFRTPPTDSTGVAHILEHSVLCGSKKFPSKDPFVELVKGSLNTFLNAMTYSDKTMYPVASCNDKDFANLMEVYMDAVFFTNIYEKEEIFRQEGWNYNLEKPEDELTYNGVVYNEMKGAYSSPEDVLDREILNSLYPDTAYGNESGGDPACIPDLKYSDFLGFHSRYYHPSNSYIYLYGDMDMEERLDWLDKEYLSKYDAIEVDSAIALQPAFEAPHEIKKKYSIANGESTEDNTYLSFNAAVGTSTDVRLALAFAVIEYALLSAPGAPLKQALLDAKVGKDIIGSYDSGTYQPIFSVVAKNSNLSEKERFLAIIREVLARIVKNGIDEKAVRAGINYMEFRYREADYGIYPKGLMYGIDVMDSWLYDDEKPFIYLNQLEVFEFLKEQVGTGYYEELIQRYLLDNAHISIVTVEPEPGLTAKTDEEVRQKLKAYKDSLSEEEIRELVEKTAKLKEFQETPSTKEELEAIPMLSISDIRKTTQALKNEEYRVDDTRLLHQDVCTNGIGYLTLLFDTKYVPEHYIPYMGILRSVLGMVDTEHYGYGELFNEINMQTGGILASLNLYAKRDTKDEFSAYMEIKAKALTEKMDFVFKMIEEIIFTSKIEDEKRLYEIIAQAKSRLQMRLNSAGHTTAALRAMSHFSDVAVFNDSVAGIAYYKLIEDIEANFEARKDELIRILKELVGLIFRKETLIVSYTSEAEALESLKPLVTDLKEKLPEGKPCEERKNKIPHHESEHKEGFQTSAKIQYVARAGNYRTKGYEYTGALRILKVILSYDYLWSNVRVKGGAYGCMSGFGYTGDSYFVSYRDPNLRATNEVFEGITDYVKNFTVDERDMVKYIIGTISDLDTPLTPQARGARALNAYMSGYTEADYQRERDQVLNADAESIRALAGIVEAVLAEDSLCVIGNEAKLQEEETMFTELKNLVG